MSDGLLYIEIQEATKAGRPPISPNIEFHCIGIRRRPGPHVPAGANGNTAKSHHDDMLIYLLTLLSEIPSRRTSRRAGAPRGPALEWRCRRGAGGLLLVVTLLVRSWQTSVLGRWIGKAYSAGNTASASIIGLLIGSVPVPDKAEELVA